MHLVGLYTYCRMMHGAYSVKLQSDIDAVPKWCPNNGTNLSVHKATLIYLTRTTNNIVFRCNRCLVYLALFLCVKDLGVLLAFRLHFHNHVDHTVAQAFKMIRPICYITSSFSSIDTLLTLCRVLVRSNLEIASVAWNAGML